MSLTECVGRRAERYRLVARGCAVACSVARASTGRPQARPSAVISPRPVSWGSREITRSVDGDLLDTHEVQLLELVALGLQAHLDGLADSLHQLVEGASLRVAAVQAGHGGDEVALGVTLDDHVEVACYSGPPARATSPSTLHHGWHHGSPSPAQAGSTVAIFSGSPWGSAPLVPPRRRSGSGGTEPPPQEPGVASTGAGVYLGRLAGTCPAGCAELPGRLAAPGPALGCRWAQGEPGRANGQRVVPGSQQSGRTSRPQVSNPLQVWKNAVRPRTPRAPRRQCMLRS
jgi:hypothetical protein